MSVSRSFHDLHFIAKSLHRFTTVRQRLCCCWYVKSKTHSAARLPRVNYKVFAVCVLCLHIGFCHLYNLHKQQGQLLNGCKKHTHTRAHAFCTDSCYDITSHSSILETWQRNVLQILSHVHTHPLAHIHDDVCCMYVEARHYTCPPPAPVRYVAFAFSFDVHTT